MKFTNCEIFYENNWVSIYNGKIKDGIFGNCITGEVKKFNKSKAQRLAEKSCLNISSYQNLEYREKLSKGIDVSSFFMEQDIQTLFTLNTLWRRSVRDKTVMDIGAGAGSFLDILPDDYPSFFYRVVHRWYFNSLSLVFCAEASGFKVEQIVSLHRYSMSNMMNWLINKKPLGNNKISGKDKSAGDLWKTYLEKNVKSDCLYLILSKQ